MEKGGTRWWHFCSDCLSAVKNRCDTRFDQRELERQFKQSLEQSLRTSMIVFCVILAVGYAMMVTMLFEKTRGSLFDEIRAYQAKHPTLVVPLLAVVFLLMYPLILLVALLLSNRLPIFRHIDMELVAILLPISICGCMPWTNEWTVSHLFSEDPEIVFGPDAAASEGRVALVLDGVITVVCLFVPVRFHLKLAPAIVAFISFTASVRLVGSPFPSNAARNVFTVSGLAVCALWGAAKNELTARQKWIACADSERKSDDLMKQHTGTSRILGMLCDSLLQLGNDFRIVAYDHRLSAMLLFGSQDIKDANFCDYIASEQNRDRFVSELEGKSQAECAESVTSAGMLHLNLKDGLGRHFTVYAYHTPTYSSIGRSGYMIALVEPEERLCEVDQGFAYSANANRFLIPHVRTASSVSASYSEESAGIEEEIAAWIDASSVNLKVLHCSTGFSSLGYLEDGTGFIQWLGSNKKDFLRSLQKYTNSSWHGDDELNAPPFTLHLRSTQHASMEFVAECLIDVKARKPASFEDCLAARIVLTKVKRRRLHSRSQKRQTKPRGVNVLIDI